ncbi:GNAT family N-acetyltransferase [Streptomyces sp. NBC_00503]|uniref:GNAT family N-acetyltransferase n=1 Tax=Streptomyces sp. NBC_00503 TaxID=2903659 RepID=UPI002E81F5F9|nr:GNAT family N-acetyltransferase [Streptomyces sp. NBC_00503]WUD84899.1 GNAT family N-acetyltransferase [Streptomyces sp. NBC_00503]
MELRRSRHPALARWFPVGASGVAALAEHVLTTGNGLWWADRPDSPRVVAVSCGDRVVLRGDPDELPSSVLASLAVTRVEAPEQFAPAMRAVLSRVEPREWMVYVQEEPPLQVRPPRGATVRRLTAEDAPALAGLPPEASWIHATWGGPHGLAGSGAAWGAFQRGRLLAVACTYLMGSRYEDVAVHADPGHCGQHLALACVNALCEDIAARGRMPSWSCSRHNRPSRLLAWQAGFRLQREYVHYATGRVRVKDASGLAQLRA